jgi:hypothetical protein
MKSVQLEALRISTCKGETFVLACGPKDAPPVVLFRGGGAGIEPNHRSGTRGGCSVLCASGAEWKGSNSVTQKDTSVSRITSYRIEC